MTAPRPAGLDRESATAFAAALPGAECSSHYGGPAIKANGHALLTPGRERGSFCLMIHRDMIEILKATDSDSWWQTPHYEGRPAVLVHHDSPDRVFAMIEHPHARGLAKKPPKPPKPRAPKRR